MTKCTQEPLRFPSFDRRLVEGGFEGGNVSSDGGVMLIRQADRFLGLCQSIDKVLVDSRDPSRISHSQLDLIRQRIYGIALGYEDLNDHNSLREDVAWQTALERDSKMASSPTLCRLENQADRQTAWAFSKILLSQFMNSFSEPPEELILDFDATDDRVHGTQEKRAFHGYYRSWCFLPLYVFCGEQLLVSYLRPSNVDGAKHAWAILKLLAQELRAKWPEVRIVFRGDSGFCRWRMLRWCEAHQIHYIVGLAKNKRLHALSEPALVKAAQAYEEQGIKQRYFQWLDYQAHTWDKSRRVILKAEHGSKGSNPRYVVSNIEGDAQELYDQIYCARGEMENRIKEQQLGLFADRTSCHAWWANQFRLLLSSAAYVLLETIRRCGLKDTDLARAQVSTLRVRLLKVGTVILRNTRRIRLLFSSSYPWAETFGLVLHRLSSA
tara:strand:- start:313 stop:1626 length:1314 start_codon:yes stop_codon:yes gene_type:complete